MPTRSRAARPLGSLPENFVPLRRSSNETSLRLDSEVRTYRVALGKRVGQIRIPGSAQVEQCPENVNRLDRFRKAPTRPLNWERQKRPLPRPRTAELEHAVPPAGRDGKHRVGGLDSGQGHSRRVPMVLSEACIRSVHDQVSRSGCASFAEGRRIAPPALFSLADTNDRDCPICHAECLSQQNTVSRTAAGC